MLRTHLVGRDEGGDADDRLPRHLIGSVEGILDRQVGREEGEESLILHHHEHLP